MSETKLVLLYCVTGQPHLQARLQESIDGQYRIHHEAGLNCPYARVLVTDQPRDAMPDSLFAFFDDFVNDVEAFVDDAFAKKRYFGLSKLRNAGLRYAAAQGFDWALLCDSDTIIADYSFTPPSTGFGVPEVYWQLSAGEDVLDSLWQVRHPDEGTFSKGNSWFLISARIFNDILFNENIYGYGYEDNEYDARFRASGRYAQTTALRVIHKFHPAAEKNIDHYSSNRNSAIFDYVTEELKQGRKIDVTQPLEMFAAKHRDWEGVLILFPESCRLVHLGQRQWASYQFSGPTVEVVWDKFGPDIFELDEGVLVNAHFRQSLQSAMGDFGGRFDAADLAPIERRQFLPQTIKKKADAA